MHCQAFFPPNFPIHNYLPQTETPIWLQTVLSLGSGIIGSVIGALATVLATQKSIIASTEAARTLEKDKALREEKERVEQAKNWIHAEIVQMQEMLVGIPKRRKLPTDAWVSTKMYLYWWKPKEQKALIHLYNEVALFNSSVDFWIHGQAQNVMANHPGELRVSMQRVKPALEEVIRTLKVVIPK